MATTASTIWEPGKPERLSRQYLRLGWIGFWLQVVMLTIPLLLLVYVLLIRTPDSASRIGIDLSNYLSFGSLIVMIFTTFWFYRYTREGKKIADPGLRPSRASLVKTLWIGLWASGLGIAFSMVLLFGAAGRLLLVLLASPQTGIMLAPMPGGNPLQSISAMDAISLTSLLVILAGELVVLGLSVWLLFRTTMSSTDEALA